MEVKIVHLPEDLEVVQQVAQRASEIAPEAKVVLVETKQTEQLLDASDQREPDTYVLRSYDIGPVCPPEPDRGPKYPGSLARLNPRRFR